MRNISRASERDAANARWGPAKPAFSLEILEASACMDGRKEGGRVASKDGVGEALLAAAAAR